MFELAWPWCFLLFALPWLWRKAEPDRQLDAPLIAIAQRYRAAGLGSVSAQQPGRQRKGLFFWLIWTLLILAAMRPQHIGEAVTLPVSGRDLLLAVDISPSMKEQDMIIGNFAATRLEAVKRVVGDFIDQRKGDRVGLILFGSEPYIQAPLTFDGKTVIQLLHEAQLGMAGKSTSIGDAIGLAVKRLRNRPAQSRVLILLTDGANTSGEVQPLKAAELAASQGIRIYTVGIGAEEMIQRGFFGATRVNPSRDLDEAMLKQLAEMTGGQYFRARNTPELEMIYETMNRLEPVEQDIKTWRPSSELYYWPLAFAFVLFGLAALKPLVKRLFALSRNRGRPGE